jgi:hypothetical protein
MIILFKNMCLNFFLNFCVTACVDEIVCVPDVQILTPPSVIFPQVFFCTRDWIYIKQCSYRPPLHRPKDLTFGVLLQETP